MLSDCFTLPDLLKGSVATKGFNDKIKIFTYQNLSSQCQGSFDFRCWIKYKAAFQFFRHWRAACSQTTVLAELLHQNRLDQTKLVTRK